MTGEPINQPMIAIIDYGMGNLRSVQKAIQHVGGDARIVSTPGELAGAEKLVLPGVGAFADAIARLREHDLVDAILSAIRDGQPFLGICLGMQLLFDVSYEDGEHKGLGVFEGEVRKFRFDTPDAARRLPIPHMGWNQISWERPCPMLEGINQGDYVYFVHSYYVAPTGGDFTLTTTDYGTPFVSSVWRENVFATQFHPEKSQAVGLRMLENFVNL